MPAASPDTDRILDEMVSRHPALLGLRDAVRQVASEICDCHERGGKVLVCGNGGSAADSEHIVGELMKSFVLPRAIPPQDADRFTAVGRPDIASKLQRGVAAVALTGHPSLSTAILNDTDPAMGFAQQVYVLGRPGDVFIGISTSGNAANVVAAACVAKALGLKTIGFTGLKASRLEEVCDVAVKAPEEETYRVQELQLPLYHAICLIVEQELFRADSQ